MGSMAGVKTTEAGVREVKFTLYQVVPLALTGRTFFTTTAVGLLL